MARQSVVSIRRIRSSVVYGVENPFHEVPTGKSNPEQLTIRHSDQRHYDTVLMVLGGSASVVAEKQLLGMTKQQRSSLIEQRLHLRTQGRAIFLYYALHQPHVPRIPSPRFVGSTDKGPRGDVIAELDWCVGEMLDHLKKQGIDEDTIVVFSSDNGPVLDVVKDAALEKCGIPGSLALYAAVNTVCLTGVPACP